MAVLLNKSDMAASLGISVQAFDKWGVEPIEKKGREVFFDVRSVLDNRLAHDRQKQQPDDNSADQEARLLRARAELTEEQVIGQRHKNERDSKKVVDTEFCTFALSRIAGEIAAVLDGLPLAVQRRFPGIEERHISFIRTEIARTMNIAAGAGQKLPDYLDEYLRLTDG
ncbi:terminase small subunit [Pantoea agglomerans]|uniref:terminase small subunit n=1 Tax=Enterobacter agglomerans TaxID=549 RepID=UPI0013B8CE72|nr:terminase small subunit [Pantoea agglomerans]NEG58199.1 DNA-packaging protein [Pantoea agglomerans]NEG99912.1 DNA-packaging protein [Pantoea agglomerans]NEH04125.1 DNA-packaging protein [Pantoea agglomerans]NEH14472.1 DNA-packaging protein [Pantoea agglomerans]